jgi:predicted ATPase
MEGHRLTVAKTAEPVGREFELEQLEATLDRIGEGEAECLSVEGEPGIGKTHLLGELRRRAESRGYLVLTAAATEFERDVPFAVWVEALDAYVASRDPGGAESWDSGLAGELSAVLPSSARAAGAATLPDERYRTHRAVRRLLELIAAGKPLVVVLDDLHWIDAASNEVLVSLLHRPPAAPILLAFGYRSGKAPAKLVGALATRSALVLELAPLNEDQCARLAGDALHGGQRAAIFQESGGNPFYMLELARAVRAPGRSVLGHRVADQAEVPPLVAATLLDEVHSRSPHARLLLECASIAGDPFEPELAFAIAMLESSAGIEALDELLDAGLAPILR